MVFRLYTVASLCYTTLACIFEPCISLPKLYSSKVNKIFFEVWFINLEICDLLSKGAAILLVVTDDDNHCSVVKALKVRDGSPLEVPTLQFGWNKEAGRHIFQGQQSKDELEKRKLEELQRIARAAFTGRSVLTATDINRYLMDTLDVKERMARNYFRLLRDHQIIQPSNQFPNNFFLNEDPQGA